MSHPRAEAFWQIPHRRDRQDDKCPTNARGRMSRLGIDWVIKEWNAWRNHDRITRTAMLIYFFVIIEVQGQSFWWYNYGYDSTHTFFWSSRTVILILKKINLKVLYSVQFRNTERWYPKINWTQFSSRVFDFNSRKTRMDRSFKAF